MISSDELPAILPFDQESESKDEFLRRAYGIFRALVCNARFVIDGVPVWVPDNGRFMERDTAFWHIATSDEGVLSRYSDVARAQHITWIVPLLSACGSGNVLEWSEPVTTRRGPTQSRYVAPYDAAYLITLRPSRYRGRPQWLLLTAFPIPSERKRLRLRATWRDYQNAGDGNAKVGDAS